jgi:cell division protein FtsB
MKQRKPIAKAPIAQFVAIIALTLSIFLIVDFGRRAAANYRVQREADRLVQEVEAAKRYQTRLLAQRTYAASDLYVEEVARQELKWSKPGETVVVVLPTPEAQYSEAAGVQAQGGGRVVTTPQQAWARLFFGDNPPRAGSP